MTGVGKMQVSTLYWIGMVDRYSNCCLSPTRSLYEVQRVIVPCCGTWAVAVVVGGLRSGSRDVGAQRHRILRSPYDGGMMVQDQLDPTLERSMATSAVCKGIV